MRSDFAASLAQLTAEKGLGRDDLMVMVEAAIASAYKKDFGVPEEHNISVRMDPQIGSARVYEVYTVVETVEDPTSEISLAAAQAIRSSARIGATIEKEVTPPNFGRIGAQTAKQVIVQKIRDAERDKVYAEFIDREGDIVSGVVRRTDARGSILEMGSGGKAEALLPVPEQVRSEHHRMGQRIRVYLLEVNRALKGPMLIVSRAHRNFVRRLMELEVPEIYNGMIEIKGIAREEGIRSKVAVAARNSAMDPVGACVGQRGQRIQNVVNELGGERIDIIRWDEDATKFVASALSPARVTDVQIDEATRTAKVVVPDNQLSLAIGKEGLNARLAAKLTGWRVDIRGDGSSVVEEGTPETYSAASERDVEGGAVEAPPEA